MRPNPTATPERRRAHARSDPAAALQLRAPAAAWLLAAGGHRWPLPRDGGRGLTKPLRAAATRRSPVSTEPADERRGSRAGVGHGGDTTRGVLPDAWGAGGGEPSGEAGGSAAAQALGLRRGGPPGAKVVSDVSCNCVCVLLTHLGRPWRAPGRLPVPDCRLAGRPRVPGSGGRPAVYAGRLARGAQRGGPRPPSSSHGVPLAPLSRKRSTFST